LILPLIVYSRGRYRSQADGLLFGVASGMAFSALESMGHGLSAFLKSGGSVGSLEATLFVRGLLSPLGQRDLDRPHLRRPMA
jgi:RsiW-degrading membrane proteinase PrsW (M82 family)